MSLLLTFNLGHRTRGLIEVLLLDGIFNCILSDSLNTAPTSARWFIHRPGLIMQATKCDWNRWLSDRMQELFVPLGRSNHSEISYHNLWDAHTKCEHRFCEMRALDLSFESEELISSKSFQCFWFLWFLNRSFTLEDDHLASERPWLLCGCRFTAEGQHHSALLCSSISVVDLVVWTKSRLFFHADTSFLKQPVVSLSHCTLVLVLCVS